MCRCLMYILIWGQRRYHSPISTLWPCSHTQCLTHSNHLLILLWKDVLEHLHFCSLMCCGGQFDECDGECMWEIAPFCPSSIVVDEKSFLITNFTRFSQINDEHLSVPIMLNAVLQEAVKGRDAAYIRPTVNVSAFFPPQNFPIHCSVLHTRMPFSLFWVFCCCCSAIFCALCYLSKIMLYNVSKLAQKKYK